MGLNMMTTAFLAAMLCIGLVYSQETNATEPLAAYGWWSSLTATYPNSKGVMQTAHCIVRDYPWRGNTQWTPLLCRPDMPYNNEYLYRLAPRGGDLLDEPEVIPGELYDFRIYMYPFSYTSVTSDTKGMLRTGQLNTTTTRYTVARVGGNASTAPLDLGHEEFHLLSTNTKGGAPRHCRVTGTGHTALTTCDTTNAAQATRFKMAFNWLWGVSLSSVEEADVKCGGYQIAYGTDPIKYVNCTRPSLTPSNFKTVFGFGMRFPGARRLTSGMEVAFKHYDPLWRYVMNRWVAHKAAPHTVTLEIDASKNFLVLNQSPYQWFRVDKFNGEEGEELASDDVVTLWNSGSQKYCCVGPAPLKRLQCDKTSADNVSCRFVMTLDPTGKP